MNRLLISSCVQTKPKHYHEYLLSGSLRFGHFFAFILHFAWHVNNNPQYRSNSCVHLHIVHDMPACMHPCFDYVALKRMLRLFYACLRAVQRTLRIYTSKDNTEAAWSRHDIRIYAMHVAKLFHFPFSNDVWQFILTWEHKIQSK